MRDGPESTLSICILSILRALKLIDGGEYGLGKKVSGWTDTGPIPFFGALNRNAWKQAGIVLPNLRDETYHFVEVSFGVSLCIIHLAMTTAGLDRWRK